MVPLKAMPDIKMNWISMFIILKTNYFQLWFLYKVTFLRFHCRKTNIKELPDVNALNLEKRQFLPQYCSEKGFKSVVVNRALTSLHAEGNLKLRLQSL